MYNIITQTLKFIGTNRFYACLAQCMTNATEKHMGSNCVGTKWEQKASQLCKKKIVPTLCLYFEKKR